MSKLFFQDQTGRKTPQVIRFGGFDQNVFDRSCPDDAEVPDLATSSGRESTIWEPSYIDPFKMDERVPKRVEEILNQADAEAHRIIAEAHVQASRLVDAAHKRGEQIEAEAYQQAFEQGEAAGKQLGEQKINPIIHNLRSVVDGIVAQQEAFLGSHEQDLVKIAFMISLQLIQREIHQDPSVILDVVRAAIAKVQRASQLTVLVSPHDFRFLEGHLEMLEAATPNGASVTVEPDEAIHRGGCRVVSDTGEIDATIDRMLENIRSRIWDEE